MSKSTLATIVGVLAMALAKKNHSGSSIRLVGGFRPIVDYKFRITVDTNIDFSKYLEDEEDSRADFELFPDDLKNDLYEYFREFSYAIDHLNTDELGFENFDLFLPNTVEEFLYIENRILFDFWFIFDKPIVASSEEELESIFDPHVIAVDKVNLMEAFIENKLMTFAPDLVGGFKLEDILKIVFLEFEWAETYPCVIDVDTGKRYKKPKHKKSNLRKR